tara:strand:- start:283 stop:564 length:282 start_codon:yes stop_codon:yes gene_type:complete
VFLWITLGRETTWEEYIFSGSSIIMRRRGSSSISSMLSVLGAESGGTEGIGRGRARGAVTSSDCNSGIGRDTIQLVVVDDLKADNTDRNAGGE